MNSSNKIRFASSNEFHGHGQGIQTSQLVVDVYETATPATRHLMLSQLMGQVYETAPPAIRSVMIQYLLRPLDVLSLATVAKGACLKGRFDNKSSDLTVATMEAQDFRTNDVIALVEHAQHVNAEVVDAIAQMIKASPVMAYSPAAAILARIPLRRASSRGVGDPVCRRNSVAGRKDRIYDSFSAPQTPSSLNDSNRRK